MKKLLNLFKCKNKKEILPISPRYLSHNRKKRERENKALFRVSYKGYKY